MPDSLEYIVRPYQSPDGHGTIVIPATPSGGRQSATLKWGAQCTIPEVSGMNFEVVCCKDQLDEKDRTSTSQRIYQNGDTSSPNWVDVERPKTMNLTKKEHNSCGDNWDDISGVAQEIDSTLAQWQSYMDQKFGTSDKNCSTAWSFKNQPS